MFICAVLYALPIAALFHVYPGSPAVLKAFVDKASYTGMVTRSYTQWLDMNKRYYGQDLVSLEDIGLPNILNTSPRFITAINFAVNNIAYAHDDVTYGPVEYFATPREMLRNGQGDCEDYAILKMHMLLAAGYPGEHMYLVVGLYTQWHGEVGGHAVLVIRDDQDHLWVLDNMRNSIIPLEQYKQFEPIAAMNWDGFVLMGTLQH